MKKLFLLSILFLILLIPATSKARTDVFLNIGLGIPLPFLIAPAPVVVAPPPIVVAPTQFVVLRPVYVQPAPVFYGPPGWYIGKHRGWYKHYR